MHCLLRVVEGSAMDQRIDPTHLLIGPSSGTTEEVGCLGELEEIEAFGGRPKPANEGRLKTGQ